jgi:hypothetical protein
MQYVWGGGIREYIYPKASATSSREKEKPLLYARIVYAALDKAAFKAGNNPLAPR